MKKIDSNLLIIAALVIYIMFMLEKEGLTNGTIIGMAIATLFVISKIILTTNYYQWVQLILINTVGLIAFNYQPTITAIMCLGTALLIFKNRRKQKLA